MQLQDLKPFDVERKTRRRVGRGGGSGLGGTSGRGHKGQNARSGGGVRPGFEGGQMPLARRLPKHGFKNFLFRNRYVVINLGRLTEAFPGATVITLDAIYERGLAPFGAPVKILAEGDPLPNLTIEAQAFSQKAAEKIQSAGGTVKSLEAKGSPEA
ncbi:MAG: 50S ribosomal protein L15 [Desulfovibrionaceae bacterium]|nr:50S ribosomal protein L15 [Desulfovibrionaceae bacterium]